MFILATIATQVSAINPATIGEDVEAVLTVLIDTVKSVQIGQTDIAGAFDGVAKMICGTLVGSAVNILAGVPEALVQCEEAMASSEASLIGSALSVGLGSYTGIGGILLEGLTAVGEAATVTVDAGVLAELFIVNSPLGGILVAALAQSVDFASDDLCGAVESAAAGTAAGKGSTAPLQSTSAISTLTSNSSTSSSTTSSPPITTTSAPSSLATSSPIPDVSNDACAACELSLYFIGVQGLASKCNVAVPLGVGSDLSVFFCDSSFNRKYAPFCNYLCANQCVTYNIQSWIQGASNQFWSSASLPLCNQECPGFEGDGRCQGGDHCPCAQGSDTCVPC
jgi:hypothetical protein